MLELGEKLRQLRIDKNITQKQVAEYLGIATNSLQSFEYGKVKPSHENLSKLANYFGVSVDYLMGNTNIPVTVDTLKQNFEHVKKTNENIIDSTENILKQLNELKKLFYNGNIPQELEQELENFIFHCDELATRHSKLKELSAVLEENFNEELEKRNQN